MPEGEVLILVNATDKQVRNAHTCLWTQCAYEVLHKKGMAGQQRGMAEQVEFPCLGATRGAEDGAEEVGEPGSTEPSEVMERRDLPRGLGGIKRQWTERRTPLQSQDGLQSCFCFAVNVTGRYLTVPRGSGWIYFFSQRCSLGNRAHLMPLHTPMGTTSRCSQSPSALFCDRTCHCNPFVIDYLNLCCLRKFIFSHQLI